MRRRERRRDLPKDWEGWLTSLFPDQFTSEFAEHHAEFCRWIWALEPGVRPDPLLFCLARKGGKSTLVETGCVAAGAPIEGEPRRRYVLYVCGTQDQADDHVKTIAAHLEDSRVGKVYPDLAEAKVDQYGDRWGWNRQRLVTQSGLIVDGYGLFGSGRGAKLEEYRPDLIVLDDVDEEDDSLDVVRKKEKRITQQVIPSGANDRAILFVQNQVHDNSVMTRLLEGQSEWLLRRREIGPIPAAYDLEYEKEYEDERGRATYSVTDGTPSWQGFDLDDIEAEINEIGPTAFDVEYQHDVEKAGGGIFDSVEFRQCTWADLPELTRTVIWVDPAVTSQEGSDCMAIQADSLGVDGQVYRLFSWEQVSTPEQALRKALKKAVELGADKVGIETDQGGDTWRSVFERAWDHLVDSDDYPQIGERTPRPDYAEDKASSHQKSKTARGMQMLEDYERGKIIHVQGTHHILEKALNRAFVKKPFDLADAAFYGWNDLRGDGEVRVSRIS